jgi:hypothetical protein
MEKRYLAFDIEIAKQIPLGQEEWTSYRPLGITCAATYDGSAQPRLWFGKDSAGEPSPQMTSSQLAELVAYLQSAEDQGYTLLTWNGLGFDFPILADESGRWEECKALALNHCDMMFHIFCLRGHTLGLDKAAKGMGLRGKPVGMSGEMAPRLWAEGKWAIVLDYVAQDVRTTYDLARAVEREGALNWRSDRNIQQSIPIPNGWLNVQQALRLPLPDTSWMRSPMRREKFTAWLHQPG